MSIGSFASRRLPGKIANALRDPFMRARFGREMRRVARARAAWSRGVTVVITSAGRLQYLERTLVTLRQYLDAGSLPVRYHIVDDFPGDAATRAFIQRNSFDVALLNSANEGLGYSLNRIYQTVETEYVLHCEDDWEFLRPIHVESLADALDGSSSSQLLLARDDGRSERSVARNFFSFNPHLARSEVVARFYPFHLFRSEKRWSEKVGRVYRNQVAGSRAQPYVRHIGLDRTGIYK